MSVLGIDIGTTGCKAVGFNHDGVVFASAYREYRTEVFDDGRAELNSDKVISNCLEVIAEVAGKSHGIAAIGISSQGEAFTPVDDKGEILGKAMVSFDARAAVIAASWSKKFGSQRLYRITGHTAHPMFTLFKLLWLRENNPSLWEKTWKFLCFEDLLQLRLGIFNPALGYSLAGRTMLFDIRKHKWSDDILSALEMNRSKLARPLPSGTVAGKVAGDASAIAGLSRDTLIVCGGHDQPCGALGAGAVEDGMAMYATGSVECICPIFSSAVMNADLFKNNLCAYDHVVDGRYTTVAFSLTGGNILKWFRDEFGVAEIMEAKRSGRDVYDILLSEMPGLPTSLLVLPYFTPSGTPYFDPVPKGTIFGLKISTKRKEIIKALLEAVTLEMRLNLEIPKNSGINVTDLRAIGGGAKSRVWTQIKADVLNKQITTVHVTEAGCMGAAMLAFSAYFGASAKTIAAQWVKTGETVQPRPEIASIYDRKFEAYKKLYPIIRTIPCNHDWSESARKSEK